MPHEPESTTRIVSLLAILGSSIFMLFSTAAVKKNQMPAATIGLKATSVLDVYRHPYIHAPSATPEPITSHAPIPVPALLAQSYLVQLIGDAEPLLKRENSKQMRPASVTKILTSLVGIEELDLKAPIVFSVFAKRVGEKISSVPAEEVFSRNDAIRMAMTASDNDAAQAIAEAVGRNKGAFSFEHAMEIFKTITNEKAKTIGLTQSHFENPTGLDDDNHYTTADDLFRLVAYIEKHHPEIWEFSREIAADIHSLDGHVYHISATNQLLSEFPGLIGGKTGLTDAAKGTLVLLYPIRPNRTAVIVILGSVDRFEDGRLLIRWLDQAFQ